jgi:hypothetical protein
MTNSNIKVHKIGNGKDEINFNNMAQGDLVLLEGGENGHWLLEQSDFMLWLEVVEDGEDCALLNEVAFLAVEGVEGVVPLAVFK